MKSIAFVNIYITFLNITEGKNECYKYLSKQKGRFCKNSEEMWNICDGTFKDCVRKGKLKCNQDKSCFGIQAHDGSWLKAHKGVKKCITSELEFKPDKDWHVYLKCDHFRNLKLTLWYDNSILKQFKGNHKRIKKNLKMVVAYTTKKFLPSQKN